jgi:hypothetical protein
MESLMAYALKYSLRVSIPTEREMTYTISEFMRSMEEAERQRLLKEEKAKLDAEFEVVWAEYLAKMEKKEREGVTMGNSMVAL